MGAKLTLNMEDLAVDSFDTTRAEKTKGTVFGEQCTCYTNCTCPGCPSCAATCPATCANTCDDATCGCSGVSCYDTDCGCEPNTCLRTNCGAQLCCR